MWEDNIYGTTSEVSAGPNIDGTFTTPGAAIIPNPVDAGGGAPASYSKDILDVFKFGVSAYSQQKQQQNLLDYKRFEATQTGLWMQGRPALFSQSAQGGTGNLVVLAAIVIGAVVLLQEKG